MKRFLCLGLLLMLVAGCTAQVDVSATSGGLTTAQKHATFIMNLYGIHSPPLAA
jgi:hypothetical protein